MARTVRRVLSLLLLASAGCSPDDRVGARSSADDPAFPNVSNLEKGEVCHIFSRGIPTEPRPEIVVTVKNLAPRKSGSEACVIWAFDGNKEERTIIGGGEQSSSRAFLESHPPLMHVVVVERSIENGKVGWRIDL